MIRNGLWAAACALLAASCGYQFQTSRSPLLAKYGVRRIFVAPIKNETYKPGVENLVYNELTRVIAENRRAELVLHPEDADAILQGTVVKADYVQAGQGAAAGLQPTAPAGGDSINRNNLSDIYVATQYTATLSVSFSLVASKHLQETLKMQPTADFVGPIAQIGPSGLPSPGPSGTPHAPGTLWSSGFSSSLLFPGHNQLGTFGTTSSLQNDSDFDRALGQVARAAMADLHESMLAGF